MAEETTEQTTDTSLENNRAAWYTGPMKLEVLEGFMTTERNIFKKELNKLETLINENKTKWRSKSISEHTINKQFKIWVKFDPHSELSTYAVEKATWKKIQAWTGFFFSGCLFNCISW